MAKRRNYWGSGGYYRPPHNRTGLTKAVCTICERAIMFGFGEEHAECRKELDRRADAAIPNPRRPPCGS
jgi:hypothetical protein